jgi:hypothetical protein
MLLKVGFKTAKTPTTISDFLLLFEAYANAATEDQTK